MKAIILQENLNKSLSFVTKLVSSRTQLPILSNVLLETESGYLKVSTTNLETSMSFWVGASVEETGAITVPAKLLSEIVASFSHEKIILSTDGFNLKLICGDSESTLSGIDAKEFPPLPQTGQQKSIILDKHVLDNGLPFVLISASQDESRPLLTGIKFAAKEEHLEMVATDGYRLSVKELPQIKGMEEGLVISAKAMADVFRLAIEEKAENIALYISKDKNQAVFKLEKAMVATRIIEGEYPVYAKIIPSTFTTKSIFNKEEMIRAVKLASVYAREAANILKFKVTKETITISASSAQIGENKTTISAKTQGEGGEIAFNARFLSDLLNVFPEEDVVFEMNGNLSPGVFHPQKDETYLHIIMPVRIQG